VLNWVVLPQCRCHRNWPGRCRCQPGASLGISGPGSAGPRSARFCSCHSSLGRHRQHRRQPEHHHRHRSRPKHRRRWLGASIGISGLGSARPCSRRSSPRGRRHRLLGAARAASLTRPSTPAVSLVARPVDSPMVPCPASSPAWPHQQTARRGPLASSVLLSTRCGR
jgi:hypothetical protein